MVTTLTLNPSLDRTLWIDKLTPGTLHRAAMSREHPSGKGINISLALHAWGHPTRICAVVGGRTGRWLREELERTGIPLELVECGGETRTNTKVIELSTGRLTELNEPGPAVSPETAAGLLEAAEKGRKPGSFAALSGSLPPGLPAGTYRTMIERLRRSGPVALDASGTALVEGIKGRPDLVKPNVDELEFLIGRALPGMEERLGGVRRLHETGVRLVALSMGADGALFSDGERVVWAKSEPVQVKSAVGCGDVLLAALLFALERPRDWPGWPERARFAVAAATAAAQQEGTVPPSYADVEAALARVSVREGRWVGNLVVDL